MISKETEDRVVALLHEDSAATVLAQDQELDPETRQVLEKLNALDEDLAHLDDHFPPVPELRVIPKPPRRNPIRYLLPLAAALVLAVLLWPQAEPEEVFRGQENQAKGKDLFSAVAAGDQDQVASLLDQRIEVNGRNEQGQSALMLAARENDLPILRLLIRAGAYLDLSDPRGRTALMLAASEGHPESTRLLLEQGADPQRRDQRGATAVDLARENDYQEVVSILESF